MALTSLLAMRARSRPGMAMAAMMPIMATPPYSADEADDGHRHGPVPVERHERSLVRRHGGGRGVQ